jgi:DNA-binding CsgD family transcriptional regulator
MRVFFPRVSFTLDYGENAHSGDLGLISVGYGFHQAWIFCAMFGASSLFMSEGILTGESLFGIPTASFISLIAYFLCLIFEGLTDQKFKAFYRKKSTVVCSALLMCVGTLLYFVQLQNEALCFVIHFIAGVTTGFGSSILLIAWGVRFARCSVTSIRVNSIVGFALAFSLYITVEAVLKYPLGGIATALFPLVELSILLTHQIFGIGKSAGKQLFSPLPVRLSTFFAKFALPIMIFCIALGFLRLVAIHPNVTLGLPYALLSVGAMAVILFAVTLLLPAQEDGWSFDFRVIGLFVAVAVAAISFGGSNQTLFQCVSALIAYLCFEGLLWMYFGEFAQSFRLSPVLIFGIGRGCAGLATTIVAVANAVAQSAYGVELFSDTTFSLVMLIVLMASYLLLPTQTEIKAILKPNALQKSIASSENIDEQQRAEITEESNVARYASKVPLDAPAATSPVAEEAMTFAEVAGADVAGAGTAGAVGVASVAGAGAASAADAAVAGQGGVMSAGAGAVAVAVAVASAGGAGAGAVGSGAQAGATEAARAAGAALSAGNSGLTLTAGAGNNTNASGAMGAPADSGNAPVKHIAKFREKCQIIGNTYMLSLREQEVLFYLAKGYNAALIQEKLYISEGTTKTHMRHIYRKLNVHTQQDLIRIVESVDLSALGIGNN